MALCSPQETAKRVIREILSAMLESIKECGTQGAPAGPMYAALMGRFSLQEFELLMGTLEKAGKVRKQGHVYYFVADM